MGGQRNFLFRMTHGRKAVCRAAFVLFHGSKQQLAKSDFEAQIERCKFKNLIKYTKQQKQMIEKQEKNKKKKNNMIAPSALFSVEKLSSHILTLTRIKTSLETDPGLNPIPQRNPVQHFPSTLLIIYAEEQGDFINAQMASSNQTLTVDSYLRTPWS
ncbi:hypothetical protein E2320_014464, partial [Naja naja]